MSLRLSESELSEILQHPDGVAVASEFAVGLNVPPSLPPIAANHTRPSASQRSRANQKRGQDFENYLEHYHADIMRNETVVIYKAEMPTRYVGDGKRVPTGSGPVDFIAIFPAGRESVFFDAKVVSGDKAGYRVPKRDKHQYEYLEAMHKMGHVAGYLIRWDEFDEIRWHAFASGTMKENRTFRRVDGAIVQRGWREAMEF